MNTKQGSMAILMIIISLVISGCGPGQLLGPTVTPSPTNTLTPTKTPLPTLTPTPSMPTYSQILSTYPANANMCNTEADVLDGDDEGMRLNGTISMQNSQFVYKCYGTKLTLQVTVTLMGITYERGALLTVDENLDWIEVSSWK